MAREYIRVLGWLSLDEAAVGLVDLTYFMEDF